MSNTAIEQRLLILEAKVAELTQISINNTEKKPGWKALLGKFQECPEFDEAMRLGAEYRNAQRPDLNDELNLS